MSREQRNIDRDNAAHINDLIGALLDAGRVRNVDPNTARHLAHRANDVDFPTNYYAAPMSNNSGPMWEVWRY